MKTGLLSSKGIPVIVLAAVLLVLLAYLPDWGGETIAPASSQTADQQSAPRYLPNAGPESPPEHPEAASNPDPSENESLISTRTDPLPPAAKPRPSDEPVSKIYGEFAISGLVVDESGRGVGGMEVMSSSKNLFAADEDHEASKTRREQYALTDIDGFYEIAGLEDGEYRIRTQPDERYEAAQAVVRAGVDTADLVLRERQPGVMVYGIVRSDVEPLDSVQVQVIGQSDGAVSTDSEGLYDLTLKASKSKTSYTLGFVREGYREKRSVVELQNFSESGQFRVDIELEPVRERVEVSGTVLNRKGKPVPGETVQLYSETARQRYSAVSDRNGEFWMEEVETSPDYMVAVHPDDSYGDFVIHDVDISLAGENLEVVLEPLALGSLTGQMVDPDGRPVPEFSLWLRNSDSVNRPDVLVTGDQQGIFEVGEVEEGTLILETRSSPRHTISGIYLSAREEKDVRLVLDLGNNRVSGLVVDETGQPITASQLYVTSVRRDSGLRIHSIRQAVTDEEGYFLFTQVGPGYHTIRIDVPGFQTTILDHDVGMDTSEVIIRLERASTHGM